MSEDHIEEDDNEVNLLAEIDGIPLPPAVKRSFWKALSQLITGVFDVPAAYLEGKAKEIRTESQAKNIVTLSAAKSAAAKFGSNKALADRAVDHFAARIVKEQANREAVVSEAVKNLSEDPPKSDTAIEIDEDWLSLFSDLASKRSSEELQQLFGKILAGEIRQPGSFSPASIQTLSTLTGKVAKHFQNLCDLSIQSPGGFTFIVINFYPKFHSSGEKSLGITYSDLVALQSAGLLPPSLNNQLDFEAHIGKVPVSYCGNNVVFSKNSQLQTGNTKKLPKLNILLFSPIGHELRSIVPVNQNSVYHAKLLQWFKEHEIDILSVKSA